MKRAGHWTILTVMLLAIYAVILGGTFSDYGITWDEAGHAEYGAEVIRWYQSGFQDRAALGHPRYRNLGSLFDIPPALVAKATGFDLYEMRHLFGAFFGLLGVVFTALLAGRLAGARAGFFAALILLLNPVFYGHAPNNPKDIPFAALSVASLYYIVVAIRHMPRLPPGLVIKLGIAIGLTLGIRIIGLTLLLYLGGAFLLWLLFQLLPARAEPLKDVTPQRAVPAFAGRFAAVAALAILTMLPWWPSLQVNPLSHLRETLRLVWHFPWNLPVLFEGRQIPAGDLPWYYLPKSLLISLPEFYLLLLLAGLVLGILMLVRRGSHYRPYDSERWIAGILLAVAVLFPAGSQILRGALVYDGWRHFLFIAPVLAVALGWILSALIGRSSPGWLKYPVAALVAASMLLTAYEMIRLHPYQSIYYNHVFGGGVREAAQSYETDYWGSSYKEGVEWIQRHYDGGDTAQSLKVASCSHQLSTTHYLTEPGFEYVGTFDHLREHPDLFLATTRWNCHERLDGKVVHVVSRLGAPILYVKEIAPKDSRDVTPQSGTSQGPQGRIPLPRPSWEDGPPVHRGPARSSGGAP
ncbi:MAG: ArnT family glycosyltransferase [Gemmatimonadales bacterium]